MPNLKTFCIDGFLVDRVVVFMREILPLFNRYLWLIVILYLAYMFYVMDAYSFFFNEVYSNLVILSTVVKSGDFYYKHEAQC